MRITLPRPPQGYDATDQATTRTRIEDWSVGALAKDQDNYIGKGRLILTDQDDGSFWEVYVASGVLSVRAL